MPTAQRLRPGFVGAPGMPEPHLSVDGMTAHGPNLSHWPGNRTPARYKADLTTGICLRFARATETERRAFLGDVAGVVNDHYDTDGFLSMLAILRPEVALPREEVCLEAAATGDYQAYFGERGFAIDRTVLGLWRSDASPLAAQREAESPPAFALRCYRWLLDHAEAVLDEPQRHAALWADEHRAVVRALDAARDGAVRSRVVEGAQLAILHSDGPVPRIVLNTLAGDLYRVLHVEHGDDGLRYRYHDRTESWFEVVSFEPPNRCDLNSLARELSAAGAVPGARWCADPPTEPVPELYHGVPAPQEYGCITRELVPSPLAAERVEAAFCEFFAQNG